MKKKINITNNSGIHISDNIFSLEVVTRIANDYDYVIKRVDFVLLNDDGLLTINKNYLNKNYLTDIITFNLSSARIIDADIYISVERIKDNAGDEGENFEEELNRVLFHGILHIVGEDDKDEDSMLKMREKEGYYLSLR